jgi:hypothetical protein
VFNGYLALGGTEVLNQQRVYTLVEESDCPPGWIRCLPCPGLDDALGDDYVGSIEEAPWYDFEDEPTHRFLGLYPVEVQGMKDSTRTATIIEGIADGGVIQGTRRAVRQIRVRGVMIGEGEDALEAGMSWLDAVLDGDNCSAHGGSCGEVDGCFFVACPPERPLVPGFSPFQTDRINLVTNPRVTAAATGYANTGTWTTAAARRAPSPALVDFPWSYGATDSGASTLNQNIRYSVGTLGAGEYRVGFWAKAGGTGSGVTARVTSDTNLSVLHSGASATLTLNDTWAWQSFNITLASSLAVYVGIHTTASSTNLEADITGLVVTNDNGVVMTANDFFDGASVPSDDLENFRWEGPADASRSIYETRFVTESPMPDADYDNLIDPLRRRIHGLTAISGPLVLSEFNNDRYFAYEIEFTLAAATPFIYGEPKVLSPGSQTSTIVQDSPFNLILPPSAELADAAGVVVATNYATNPSIETNTTGWSPGGDPPVSTSGTTVGSRDTTIAANGVASYRVRFTASSGGTGGSVYATTTFPISTAQNRRRASINVWLYAAVAGGTAVLGNRMVGVDFLNASSVVVGSVTLGPGAVAGGVVSVRSTPVPSSATQARVVAYVIPTSWSTGAVIDLYVDAVAVTIP